MTLSKLTLALEKNQTEEKEGMFDNELYGGSQPKAWTKMVKYVQTRFSDDQSVKSLYAQKKLKEDIFKTIYESF